MTALSRAHGNLTSTSERPWHSCASARPNPAAGGSANHPRGGAGIVGLPQRGVRRVWRRPLADLPAIVPRAGANAARDGDPAVVTALAAHGVTAVAPWRRGSAQ